MDETTPATILHHFAQLNDPRIEKKIDHKLTDIMVLTILAVISGADTWVEVQMYGESKLEWLRQFIELPNGIPAHDTLGRVFAVLSPDEFEVCFQSWINSVFEVTNGEIVPIDGKTLRRSHDRASKKSAIHMVSAWASRNNVALGQVKTDDKSNEITAIPKLIEMLDLKGCIVTIDAMGCQRAIAEKIVDKGADYILALKGNQDSLHESVDKFFQEAKDTDFNGISFDYHETREKNHGRVDVRHCYTIKDLDWLPGAEKWKNLKLVGMVESERHVDGAIRREARLYIGSRVLDAKRFGEAVRGHWGIENGLHWKLDIAFREDESRMRKGHSSQNFAVIRHLALNLLNQDKTTKVGTAAKRKKAAMDNDYLLHVLAIAV